MEARRKKNNLLEKMDLKLMIFSIRQARSAHILFDCEFTIDKRSGLQRPSNLTKADRVIVLIRQMPEFGIYHFFMAISLTKLPKGSKWRPKWTKFCLGRKNNIWFEILLHNFYFSPERRYGKDDDIMRRKFFSFLQLLYEFSLDRLLQGGRPKLPCWLLCIRWG